MQIWPTLRTTEVLLLGFKPCDSDNDCPSPLDSLSEVGFDKSADLEGGRRCMPARMGA